MTIDREGLKRWYRGAMHRRLDELRELRPGLRSCAASACDAARAVGQALRGSGATYGYPELSTMAAMVESASDATLYRRVEGLVEYLRRLATEEPLPAGAVWAEWLMLAAEPGDPGRRSAPFLDLDTAWKEVAADAEVSTEELAARVATTFRLGDANLDTPSRAALRLVPEALIRSEGVLPMREDSETITVATSDPTSLRVEDQLQRVTGRRPVIEVVAPEQLGRAIAAALDVSGLSVGPGRAAGSSGSAARPAAVAGPVPDPEGSDRVLIVDDDPADLLLARRVLLKGGYDVEEAADGAEALERLDSDRAISLVVADLNMPRLDGLELIWEIRAKEGRSRLPVIVVTGETDEVLETKLIEEGADDYIRKPLDPRLFLARVAATIRRAEH